MNDTTHHLVRSLAQHPASSRVQLVRRSLRSAILFALVGMLLPAATLPAVAEGSFQIVVNTSNPISEIDKGQLSKLFLKRARSWENNRVAQPVDQMESSSVRADFSKSVHGRSVKAIKSYWLRMIFSGDGSAPLELSSDSAVLSYVADNTDAVGYIAAGTQLPTGVKTLTVVD